MGAVSNAIGSQIINILIGLGLPWMITDMVQGHCIRLYAHKSLQYAAFFQFIIVGTFLTMLLGVALIFGQNKAILTKNKATFLMSGYFVVVRNFSLLCPIVFSPFDRPLTHKSFFNIVYFSLISLSLMVSVKFSLIFLTIIY